MRPHTNNRVCTIYLFRRIWVIISFFITLYLYCATYFILMNMKRHLLLFVALIAMVNQLYADVIEGQCGDDVVYVYNTDTRHMVVRGNGAMYDYDQDNTGPFYALSHHMNTLAIEEGVTHIGNRAFWGCYALGGTIELPSSVTSIGNEAFYGCNYLTGLVMSPSVVAIGDYAFGSCFSLECALLLPDCLETIGEGAFTGCKKLQGDLLIPNSVKTIGNNAFGECEGFTGMLYLGSSLETIGERAFAALNITGSLVIPETVTSIGCSAFEDCKNLTGDVVIPKGVTTIEDGVLRNCSGITGITLLGQVTHIRNSAFSHCTSLVDFVCYATTPPDATEYYVFDNTPLNTVYVPAESVDMYKEAPVWKDFEILPIGGSGISSPLHGSNVCVSLQNGILMVKAGNGLLKGVSLVDANGVEVLSDRRVSSSVELDMSSVSSGIYLVNVVTNTGHYCRKVVK